MYNFDEYMKALNRFRRKKFFKYGIPFFSFLLLGSFGLKHFASVRYEFRRNKVLHDDSFSKLGIKKKETTLEEEYEKLKSQVDIDNWENIRGPRPWEEPQETQKK